MNGPVQADGDLPAGQLRAPVVREVEIVNKKGLHARASAKFVQTAEQFDAAITVTRGHETVGGTSIMGLMMLAAGPGVSITIQATGSETRPRRWTRCARWSPTGSAKRISGERRPARQRRSGYNVHKEIFIYALRPRPWPVIGTPANPPAFPCA